MRADGRGFIVGGLTLIACALLLTGYNILTGAKAGREAAAAAQELTGALSAAMAENSPAPDIAGHEYAERLEMPVKTVDGVDYVGVLNIPALELNLPIVSRWSYDALKHAPCRYSGTAYAGNLVICAHNYQAHFGRIKGLEIGEELCLTDAEGNEFRYAVAAVETLPPGAVEEMTAGEWPLTLFTCTVGGQYRVAVRCDGIEG